MGNRYEESGGRQEDFGRYGQDRNRRMDQDFGRQFSEDRSWNQYGAHRRSQADYSQDAPSRSYNPSESGQGGYSGGYGRNDRAHSSFSPGEPHRDSGGDHGHGFGYGQNGTGHNFSGQNQGWPSDEQGWSNRSRRGGGYGQGYGQQDFSNPESRSHQSAADNRAAASGARQGPRDPYGYEDYGQYGGVRQPTSETLRSREEHDHDPHYSSWRDQQLSKHDNDYNRWRSEQAARYDNEYKSWRDKRHEAFSKEFETWRSGQSHALQSDEMPKGAEAGQSTIENVTDGGTGHQERKDDKH